MKISVSVFAVLWYDVVPRRELSYILGNPPFSGRRYRTAEQIEEVAQYFSFKDIDYVACWFKKSALFIQNSDNEAPRSKLRGIACQDTDSPQGAGN